MCESLRNYPGAWTDSCMERGSFCDPLVHHPVVLGDLEQGEIETNLREFLVKGERGFFDYEVRSTPLDRFTLRW